MTDGSRRDGVGISWQSRYRIPILVVTLAVVVGGAVSVLIRTGDVDIGSTLVLAVATLPSLLTVLITVRWQIWLAECVLAVVGWAFFLGPGGDLSCVDCGFALLIPLTVALPQGILLLLGFLLPDLRRRDPQSG